MSLYVSRTFRRLTWSDGRSPLPVGKVAVIDAVEARNTVFQLGLGGDRAADSRPGPTAGELAALSLLDDFYLRILDDYIGRRDSSLMGRVLAALRAHLGAELLDRLLMEFAEEYLGARTEALSFWIEGQAEGRDVVLDRPLVLKQILVFWLLHGNPAARPIVRRTHDSPMLEIPAFREMVDRMVAYLEGEPSYEDPAANLWQLLVRPQLLSPDSLDQQLVRLKATWPGVLGDLGTRLDVFLGMLAEERAPRLPPGPAPAQLPRYQRDEDEVRFSLDRDWMPSLVLVAKHTLVWLHQLSTIYGRPVERLDQIPDAELERLAALGFDGLWLIGLWQRSPVSEKIKKLCGNPEAAASAYSLTRYEVAEELGGESALQELRHRAAGFGIRLAADMVPNHTGLDSDWIVHRPDWFIGQERSPFPAYSFKGPDLSSRPEIGIYLEDHYFDRSDAAVVFKRIDRQTGEQRYIYHGNDGTSTPWNDTAQLNYLNPEIWPAVIDAIVEVARRFPIIRFDAAMTLTRRHFQRLWYPAPGTAGDIPSRAEHGMTSEAFLAAMPEEFWRQVVDRVAEEAPNTLLLAEAFWLMEGFFVRSLGMHRVYNSAFMNMLRDGETPKFRRLIKETLVFDPGILKRYVNFMSNPDEKTAMEQFGDGDRYFGTCVLMATLPGLPMFGHGQIEGLRERYGMEYRRPYYDERPREDLVQRHLRQIAPLLHQRERFADVAHFRLFDLVTDSGRVHDHVIAYSNGSAEQATIVVFNNSDHPARGRLQSSAPFVTGSHEPGEETRTVGLAEVLPVGRSGSLMARDLVSGLEYLYLSSELTDRGMQFDLGPWGCRVLSGFQPMDLPGEVVTGMSERLRGQGVESLEALRLDVELDPWRRAWAEALDPDLFQRLLELPTITAGSAEETDLAPEIRSTATGLAARVGTDPSRAAERALAALALPEWAAALEAVEVETLRQAGAGLRTALERAPELLPVLLGWALLTAVEEALAGLEAERRERDWRLESILLPRLLEAGADPAMAARLTAAMSQALRSGWGHAPVPAPAPLELQRQILADEGSRRVLGANQFEGREYISREALESYIDLRLALEAVALGPGAEEKEASAAAFAEWWRALERLVVDAEAGGYRTEQLGLSKAEEAADEAG